MIIHKWKHNYKHNSFLPLKIPQSYTLEAEVKSWSGDGTNVEGEGISGVVLTTSVRNMNVFTQIFCNPFTDCRDISLKTVKV